MSVPSRPSQAPSEPPKLAIARVGEGEVTCLRFTGTIDEQFGGAALGATIDAGGGTGVLVIDLGGVRKISSFGIREWVDFMSAARGKAREVLLVECAPKVVDQLNMVANFASGARVYSVYAPFRCDFCDSEHRVLLQVDRHADAIKAMALPERACPACKQAMYFDDDGATFFSYLAGQARVELAPAVAAFLATHLDYALADGTRKLRVDKLVDGRATYLRLAGDLDLTFPADKLAEGLEGEVFADVSGIARIDPAGAAEWRAFVQLVTPGIDALWIAGASAVFRDKLGGTGDLGPKAAILDDATTPPELRARLDALRGRAAASRPSEARLKRASQSPPNAPQASQALVVEVRRTPLWVPVVAALIALAVAIVVVVIYRMITAIDDGRDAHPAHSIAARSADVRPAWVADSPGCTTSPTGALVCAGESARAERQDDAEEDAADAVYDELAVTLSQRIEDPAWRAHVEPVVRAARDAKTDAVMRDHQMRTPARREVRAARHAVALLLHATGGTAVPPAPTARYWERHTPDDEGGIVAYAQLVVAPADLARLAATFTHTETALGATAVTAFPGLGWRNPHLERGAFITQLAPGVLRDLGLAEGTVVLAVDGRDVTDAASFAQLVTAEQADIASHGGVLRLKVQDSEGAPRELAHTYPVPAPAHATGPVPPTHEVPTGGINVWDRYGGNRGSGSGSGSGGGR